MGLKTQEKKSLRLWLYLKQDGLCHWCGCQMQIVDEDRPRIPENAATFDHIYPRREREEVRKGGNPRAHYRVLACRRCNRRRGETNATEWEARVRAKRFG